MRRVKARCSVLVFRIGATDLYGSTGAAYCPFQYDRQKWGHSASITICYFNLSGGVYTPGSPRPMSSRLGEILIKESLITSDQLRQALEHQKANGGQVGDVPDEAWLHQR